MSNELRSLMERLRQHACQCEHLYLGAQPIGNVRCERCGKCASNELRELLNAFNALLARLSATPAGELRTRILARMDKVGRETFLPRQKWQEELERTLAAELEQLLLAQAGSGLVVSLREAVCNVLYGQANPYGDTKHLDAAIASVLLAHGIEVKTDV
jgi:hypothetical protein